MMRIEGGHNMTDIISEAITETNAANEYTIPALRTSEMRRRQMCLADTVTVDKRNYTVVSIFPTAYDDTDGESAEDKLTYLISGNKVNKKLSGLVNRVGV